MKRRLKIFLSFFIIALAFCLIKTEAEITEVASMYEGASIKTEGTQGLRFKAHLNIDSNDEHGFYLVYGTTSLNELEAAINNAVNDKITLNDKKVFKVPVDGLDENADFSVVLIGIPEEGYLQMISVFAYVGEKIISKEETKSVAKVAFMQANDGSNNPVINTIISSLNINFIFDFLNSSYETAIIKGIITHLGDYPNYVIKDASSNAKLIINKTNILKKGDEVLIKVKKTNNNIVLADDNINVISEENEIETLTLDNVSLTTSNLKEHHLKLVNLSNLYVVSVGDLKSNLATITLMNSKTENITLTFHLSSLLEHIVDDLTLGKLVNLNGALLEVLNKPILYIDNSEQLDILDNITPKIEIIGENSVDINDELVLDTQLTYLTGDVFWESNDTSVLTINNGVVTPLKIGQAMVIASIGSYFSEITISVIDSNTPPKFILLSDYKETTRLNWNKPFDPLKGLKVTDVNDGDITNQIVINNQVDNKAYGLQSVTLTVTNSYGKTTTLIRYFDVVWDYDVTFVGHAGSFYGIMNTEEAIMYAIEVLKYQAVEVDLKQTKDGVFVLCHDDIWNGYTLAQTNWDVLKNVSLTQSRNSGIPSQNGSMTNSPYTSTLITLERFLQICKDYNVDAVIELKYSQGINNNDQSRMQAFMNVVEETGMLNNVILLGSQYNCLIWTRQNGYAFVPCQYLVTSMENETILQRCIDYDLDISASITGTNTDAWIARYKSHGKKVAVYTFNQYNDYPLLQSWINRGVDFVTVDWHIMSNLTLPETSTTPLEEYQVTFKDYDGTVLSVAATLEGKPALAPTVSRLGYKFTGWDKDITAIFADLTVTAQYQIETYTITYNPNIGTQELVSWTNKQAFIDEFYNDFYNWLLQYANDLDGVTITGNQIKVVKSGVTVTINNVSELKTVNIYDFEKTFGTLIYLPFTRVNNEPIIMDINNNYFLNTSPYKVKYQELDAWYLNAMVNNYVVYDRGYGHAANGRVQIMFRFHQWQQGTSIPQFNTLPKKTLVSGHSSFNYELPTTYRSYTILDAFDLPLATGEKEFLGWYLDNDLTLPYNKIILGSTGNITVYAKWAE